MNYTEIQIESTTEELQQTLIALLNNIGYEGFEESMENFSFKSFINDNDFDENLLTKTLEPFKVTFIKTNK